MTTYRFRSYNDVTYAAAALQLAAAQYREFAKTSGQPRIAEQFQHQAEVAERIADELYGMEG